MASEGIRSHLSYFVVILDCLLIHFTHVLRIQKLVLLVEAGKSRTLPETMLCFVS